MRWSWMALFLVACGVSEDEFQEEFSEKTCALMFECAGDETSGIFFESEEDCVALFSFAWSSVPDECGYDKKAAKDCLAALDAASCDEAYPDGYDRCQEVYTGDGCGELFGASTDS